MGFSLVDYQQNTFNPLAKTLIVIRALVPNGVAQLDGRLMPGQRLVRINEVNLDDIDQITTNLIQQQHLSQTPSNHTKNPANNYLTASSNSNIPLLTLDLLKFTVDLLKSLPIGKTVRLGVQKPLPYPDAATSMNSTTTKTKKSSKNLKENVANSKSVSHLNHKVPSKDETLNFSTNEKSKIPMSTQITRRNKSSDTPNKFRQSKKLKKKIITTSHYDLETSSSSSSTSSASSEASLNDFIDDIESKPESENSPLDKLSCFDNENYSEEIEPISSHLEKSGDSSSSSKTKRVAREDMKYGFIATSAPAILDIESYILDNKMIDNSICMQGTGSMTASSTKPNLNGHLFYASASQLKLNTRDFYNQIYGSNTNTNKNESNTVIQAAVSASELKSLKYNQTIEVKIKK